MAITLPVQSMQPLPRSGDAGSVDLNAQLNAGRTLNASVREVTPDPQRPNVFRIKVEVQKQLMELITSQPLTTGTRIALSRGAGGTLQLALAAQSLPPQNTPPTPAAPNTAQGSAQPPQPTSGQLQLQIPADSRQNEALTRLLPLNQPQTGRVVSNGTATSTPGTAAPTPTPAPTPATAQPPARSENTTATARPADSAHSRTSRGEQPATPASPGPRVAPDTQARTTSQAQVQTTPAAGNDPAPTTRPSPPSRDPGAAQPQPAAPAPQAETAPRQPRTGEPAARDAAPTQRPQSSAAAVRSAPQASAQPPLQAPPQVAQPGSVNMAGSPPATQSSGTAAQAPAERVQISIGGQRVELISPRPLQAGLTVEITRTGPDKVQLQISPPPVDSGAQTRLQEGLQQILRENLPHQVPMGDALNQLRQLSTTKQGNDAVGQVVKSLLSLFTVAPKADSKATKQAIQSHLQSSGLIRQPTTEAKGAQRKQPPLQNQLARLQQVADRLPTEARDQMMTLVKSLQARSASHQASSLQSWQEMPDGSIERQYRLDLPVRISEEHLDDTEILIKQHKRPDEQDRFVSEWSINLHFEREVLGTIDVRVNLQRDWQLSAQFWAQSGDTAQLIKERLGEFEHQLRGSGFEVDTLYVRRGTPPQDEKPLLSRRLVDLHT